MRRFALLSFFFLIALIAPPLAGRGAAQQAPHDSIKGAVRSVDVPGRVVEVTTGVGMALRVVRLQVPAETRITSGRGPAGAAIALALLRPGDLVFVSYGSRPAGLVAYSIARVGTMTNGPERAP
jgi:hypothetical protein